MTPLTPSCSSSKMAEMDQEEDSFSTTSTEDSEQYDPSTPYVVDLDYRNGRTYEYDALLNKEMMEIGPSFQLPHM